MRPLPCEKVSTESPSTRWLIGRTPLDNVKDDIWWEQELIMWIFATLFVVHYNTIAALVASVRPLSVPSLIRTSGKCESHSQVGLTSLGTIFRNLIFSIKIRKSTTRPDLFTEVVYVTSTTSGPCVKSISTLGKLWKISIAFEEREVLILRELWCSLNTVQIIIIKITIPYPLSHTF